MTITIEAGLPSAVGSGSDWESRDSWFEPRPGHIFVEIYHEIISMVILPLPLIQEGQVSLSGKSICTKYWLIT